MKARVQILGWGGFLETIEVEGTPEEMAAFVRARQTGQQAAPPAFVPWFQIVDACPMGGAHEYPPVWLGVFPPPCTKCGRASEAPPQWTVTWADNETNPMPLNGTTTVTQQGVLVGQLEDLRVRQDCSD